MRIFRRMVVTTVCLPALLLARKSEKLKCLLGHFLGKGEAPPSALETRVQSLSFYIFLLSDSSRLETCLASSPCRGSLQGKTKLSVCPHHCVILHISFSLQFQNITLLGDFLMQLSWLQIGGVTASFLHSGGYPSLPWIPTLPWRMGGLMKH